MKLNYAKPLLFLIFSWFVLAIDTQIYLKRANDSCQLIPVLYKGRFLQYNCPGETHYMLADEEFIALSNITKNVPERLTLLNGTIFNYKKQHSNRNYTHQLIRFIDYATAHIKQVSLNIANYFQLRTKPCQINQKMATSKDGSKYLHILVEATKTCDKLAQISAILESMEEWLKNNENICGIWCTRESDKGTWEGLILIGVNRSFSLESCGNSGAYGQCEETNG